MALELVECPYCNYKFRKDIKAIENEGKIKLYAVPFVERLSLCVRRA